MVPVSRLTSLCFVAASSQGRRYPRLACSSWSNYRFGSSSCYDPSVLNLHKNEEEYAKKYYYSMIEQMFPDGAYLDMFANTAHNEKWSLWSEIVKNAMIEEK